jgi:CubicO group peptidase (beta-lactamase class C family)
MRIAACIAVILAATLFAACSPPAVTPEITELPTPGPTQAPAPTPAPAPDYDFSQLTKQIDEMIDTLPLEGAAMVLIKDGDVIYEYAAGSYQVDTVEKIASASKWLAAATIMTLVDEGLLALDDPVSMYIPEFTGDKANITIRQLLSHTAGLPDTVPCSVFSDITSEECILRIAEMELLAEPGTVFKYGGVSFQVAGRVAEVVTGKPWKQLFFERIVRPIRMSNTSFGPSRNPLIGGSGQSSAREYAYFLTMLMNEGQSWDGPVLSPEAVKEMLQNQTADAKRDPSHADMAWSGANMRYGLGAWIETTDGSGNPIRFSSAGAYGCYPWLDLDRNITGVFVTKDRFINVAQGVREIRQISERIIDGN